MQIAVDVQALKEKADSIKQTADFLNDNMHMIEKTVLDLGYEWQGEAELAYAAKILYVKKQFDVMYEFISSLSMYVKTVANNYEQLEYEIKKLLEVY